tara:strand:- start:677 stop:1276 length:600 start_codon:yes stop_codon:yes gene_type:complete
MSLSHINNIKRSDLDKHIHIKKFYLYKIIPDNDIIDYIIKLTIDKDSKWVSLGYQMANIKYLWIEYYFNIILKNFGNSEYLTVLFNKIDYDYINIKSILDCHVCDIYNNVYTLPEYPDIKITKLFYNLLNIDKIYTSQIKGIYPKKLDTNEIESILMFLKLNFEYINKIKQYFEYKMIYINQLEKHLHILENEMNNLKN